MHTDFSLRRFVQELASDKPYPGGGSAACLVGALGVALSLMVGRIVQKRKKKSDEKQKIKGLDSILNDLSKLQNAAIRSVDGDIRSYKKVVQAYSLKKGSRGRAVKIEKALKGGYLFQKNFAATLLKAKRAQKYLERVAQGSIASDLILSKHFLKASFLGAIQTARINLEYMKDKVFRDRESKTLVSLAKQFER